MAVTYPSHPCSSPPQDDDAHDDSGNGPSTNRERSQTVKGDKGEGSSTQTYHVHAPPPPFSARLCATAVRRSDRKIMTHMHGDIGNGPSNFKPRAVTDGEGRKRGEKQYIRTLLSPSPPACAPPLSGARKAVTASDTSMPVCAQINNKDMGGRGYFPLDKKL